LKKLEPGANKGEETCLKSATIAGYEINVLQFLATTANAFLTPEKVCINHLSHLINCLSLQRSLDW